MGNFADRVIDAQDAKGSCVVVGLDPGLDKLPAPLVAAAVARFGAGPRALAEAVWRLNRDVLDGVAPFAVAVKPQLAFYEVLGSAGLRALERTLAHARKRGLLVINDAKRGDIGTTAQAYAAAHLGHPVLPGGRTSPLAADAVTVNAYLGLDGVKPFLDSCRAVGAGIFVLVKTSNPSAAEFQDLDLAGGGTVHERVAAAVRTWGGDLVGAHGWSSVGAVAAATYPEAARRLRELLPRSLFLVPGYGAQGAGADDAALAFGPDGLGGLVASSRGITFPSAGEEGRLFVEGRWREAAATAARNMRDALNEALARRGLLRPAWRRA